MMKRLLLCLLLLVACRSEQPTLPQSVVATATPVPPVVQGDVAVVGRLVYVQGGQLWLHTARRTEALAFGANGRDPAWSADGRKLAFVRRGESFADVYVWDAATQQATRITFNDSPAQPRSREYVHAVFWAAQPTWGPRGDEIVFLSQAQTATTEDSGNPIYEYPLSLYRYALKLVGKREPTNADQIALEVNGDVQRPAWSPDGKTLAYVEAPRDGSERRMMRLVLPDGVAEPFPGVPMGAYDPAWSPDGTLLAFAAATDGATDIWVVSALGGAPQRVTKLGSARAPAWSPDGSQLAVINIDTQSSDVYVAAVQRNGNVVTGGAAQPLTKNAQVDASAGLAWGR